MRLAVAVLPQKKKGGSRGKSKCGIIPLLRAAREGHVEDVRILLASGADVNVMEKVSSMRMETPLTVASEGGHTEVVRLLLAAGANFRISNRKTEVLQTALMRLR